MIERYTLKGARPPTNSDRNRTKMDTLLPSFFWDDLLILKPGHEFEYNENQFLCHPCMDSGKDPSTQERECLSQGKWTFDDQRKTLILIPDSDDPYFVSILPYAKNRGDTIEITHLRRVVQRGAGGREVVKRIIGELKDFYRPSFFNGTDASMCDPFGTPMGDLYGAKMVGAGGGTISLLREGTYVRDGMLVIQKACFENSSWRVVSQDSIEDTFDTHKGQLNKSLPDFVPGGVLTLNRDTANDSLSWTYSQPIDNAIQPLDRSGGIAIPNQEVILSGRWKYALSDKSLTLTPISNRNDKALIVIDGIEVVSDTLTGRYCKGYGGKKCFKLTLTKVVESP